MPLPIFFININDKIIELFLASIEFVNINSQLIFELGNKHCLSVISSIIHDTSIKN